MCVKQAILTMNIWKSYNVMWTIYMRKRNEYGSNLCSYEHYLSSSENKVCTGFEPMSSVILVQHSTSWVNKPTGSWSLCWFQINLWYIYCEDLCISCTFLHKLFKLCLKSWMQLIHETIAFTRNTLACSGHKLNWESFVNNN